MWLNLQILCTNFKKTYSKILTIIFTFIPEILHLLNLNKVIITKNTPGTKFHWWYYKPIHNPHHCSRMVHTTYFLCNNFNTILLIKNIHIVHLLFLLLILGYYLLLISISLSKIFPSLQSIYLLTNHQNFINITLFSPSIKLTPFTLLIY